IKLYIYNLMIYLTIMVGCARLEWTWREHWPDDPAQRLHLIRGCTAVLHSGEAVGDVRWLARTDEHRSRVHRSARGWRPRGGHLGPRRRRGRADQLPRHLSGFIAFRALPRRTWSSPW